MHRDTISEEGWLIRERPVQKLPPKDCQRVGHNQDNDDKKDNPDAFSGTQCDRKQEGILIEITMGSQMYGDSMRVWIVAINYEKLGGRMEETYCTSVF